MKCGPTCKAHFNTNSHFGQQFAISIKNPHVFIQFYFKFLFGFWFWLSLNRYCYSTLFLLIFTVSFCLNQIPYDDFTAIHWVLCMIHPIDSISPIFDFERSPSSSPLLIQISYFSHSQWHFTCECKLNTHVKHMDWNEISILNGIELNWSELSSGFSFLHALHFTNREQYTFQHINHTQITNE